MISVCCSMGIGVFSYPYKKYSTTLSFKRDWWSALSTFSTDQMSRTSRVGECPPLRTSDHHVPGPVHEDPRPFLSWETPGRRRGSPYGRWGPGGLTHTMLHAKSKRQTPVEFTNCRVTLSADIGLENEPQSFLVQCVCLTSTICVL